MISRPAVLSIYVPANYPESSIDIKTTTPELFKGSPLLVGESSIEIPWLVTRKCVSRVIYSYRDNC